MPNLAILFAVLLASWLLLSGIYNIYFISLGVASCLIAVVFYRIAYKEKILNLACIFLHMVSYVFWLIKEITKSSIDISLKMWQLEPDISPQTAWIPCDIHDDVEMTIFANSITLTPGTVTIGTGERMLHVHSLTVEAMEDLQKGEMLKRVNSLTRKRT